MRGMTPGSPFSNVLGSDQDSSTFKNVETTQTSDTTSETQVAPTDNPTESSVGVERAADNTTHESGQDETAGDESSGTPTFNT